MTLMKVAAIVGAEIILATAPALAGPTSPARPQWVMPDPQVEQIRHRRNVIPESIIGGVISGVVGGLIGGNCYYNYCGYDNGTYYGGGGYCGGAIWLMALATAGRWRRQVVYTAYGPRARFPGQPTRQRAGR